MRIFVDTADLDEIATWAKDDRIDGFTTNPTLMRAHCPDLSALEWATTAIERAGWKQISIDGPVNVCCLGTNVALKLAATRFSPPRRPAEWVTVNWTAVCNVGQTELLDVRPRDIVSVFAGRIMDTGRDPQPVIDAAKATGAQVLWASVREPYNIVQAEAAGCDIITVPPAILRKYLDWHGKPLEAVGAITVEQFDRDREGLW